MTSARLVQQYTGGYVASYENMVFRVKRQSLPKKISHARPRKAYELHEEAWRMYPRSINRGGDRFNSNFSGSKEIDDSEFTSIRIL